MKIVLFGPPGSGKGTQANMLKEHLDVPHLSTGDLLRSVAKETGPLADEVRAVPVGHFASDELIVKLLIAELNKEKYSKGVLLDGFPRTKAQADVMFNMGLQMDMAINFSIDEEKLISRIVNRRLHPSSGRIYNLLSNPPKQDGIDDVTGELLVHREDDREDVVQKRFDDYRNKTLPAVEMFKQSGVEFLNINADQDSDVIFNQIIERVSSLNGRTKFKI